MLNPTTRQSFDRVDATALLAIWAVTVTLLSRQLFNPSLGYPDADRLLMDGVFLRDFLRDMPLTDIYGYTINYFGQYPALSIGYRPPFFPFVEALFNLVFGINMWSSRLAIQAFALTGITAWFLLVRAMFDRWTAFLACLLFVSLPFVAKWGWYTMGELPLVSMTMLTAYFLCRYMQDRRPLFLYATAIAFVLTVWTKQTAFYLGVWFILVLLLDRSLLSTLRNRHAWIALALIALALAPLVAITLWLGDQNLAQSVGTGVTVQKGPGPWARRVANLGKHIDNLVKLQLTDVALVLSLVGLGFAAYRRDRRILFFVSLILTTYLFFSYILNPNERYTIFWLPAFAVLAALPVYYIKQWNPRAGMVGIVVTLAVVGFQVQRVYSRPPNYATGYDVAAQHVVVNSSSPTVFVDAYNNGYFTYFVRKADEDRSMYVLRGDKLLTSSSIMARSRLAVHAESREDIMGIFDQYGVEYVVVEDRNYTRLEIHDELRALLETSSFALEKSIPIEVENRTPLVGVTLLVYRYLEAKRPSSGELELRLPVVGKKVVVPFRVKGD